MYNIKQVKNEHGSFFFFSFLAWVAHSKVYNFVCGAKDPL